MLFSSVASACLRSSFIIAMFSVSFAMQEVPDIRSSLSLSVLFFGFRLSARDRRAVKVAADKAAQDAGVSAEDREASRERRGQHLRDDIMMAVDPEGEVAAHFSKKGEGPA